MRNDRLSAANRKLSHGQLLYWSIFIVLASSSDFLMTNLDKNNNVGHGRWFPKIKQRHFFCKNYDDDVIGVFPSNLDIISKLNRFHSELLASTRRPTDEIFFSSSSLSLDQNKLSVSTKRWPVANFHQSGRRRRKREFSLFVMLDLSMCGKLFFNIGLFYASILANFKRRFICSAFYAAFLNSGSSFWQWPH